LKLIKNEHGVTGATKQEICKLPCLVNNPLKNRILAVLKLGGIIFINSKIMIDFITFKDLVIGLSVFGQNCPQGEKLQCVITIEK